MAREVLEIERLDQVADEEETPEALLSFLSAMNDVVQKLGNKKQMKKSAKLLRESQQIFREYEANEE